MNFSEGCFNTPMSEPIIGLITARKSHLYSFPVRYWQYPYCIGPVFVISHGNFPHSKQNLILFSNAQDAILQNLFSFGTHPFSPFGHLFCLILGHFSQPIPQTPILIIFIFHLNPKLIFNLYSF
jgi:hypothetical protein